MLDTCQYEIKFLSGEINTYTANTVSENFYSHVNLVGHKSLYLAEILDNSSDRSAISKDDGYTTSNAKKIPKRKTIHL